MNIQPLADATEQWLAVLLADIVDSTQIHQSIGEEAARRLWATHDMSARTLLRTWRGREVGRSDGFLLLFESCEDAVEFAAAYHSMLSGLDVPFSARVGLHWGAVTLRGNSSADIAAGATPFEVDGLAIPTAARVMSVAQGGQTLMSEFAARAMASATSSPQRLRSHGHWRLKGLAEPLALHEIDSPDRPSPPLTDSSKAYRVAMIDGQWMPVTAVPNNLGPEPDRFVGRVDALRTLADAFEVGARLVTVLGTGGVGKTRLAQRFGRAWLGSYPGGVWFCDLASATSVDGIALAVAQAVDMPLGAAEPVQRLSIALTGRGECLLILDNFEQVARFADATLGVWLRSAPLVRFLVTSREVLGLTGEQVQVLAPMSGEEGCVLFDSRRRSAGISDAWGEADVTAVPQLVELLDRLPLAIELSAARANLMPPADQIQRISERFQLLARHGGRRDRQATLRATLDWSWDLLSAHEQSALAQLSVFEGGFTLAAAEAVLDLTAFSGETWAPDAVQSLVQKSLVRRVNPRRFDLIRTVQEYAAEKRPLVGHAADRRHWRYFAELHEADVIANRCAEIDNLVTACRRATAADSDQDRSDSAGCAVRGLVNCWTALRLLGPFRVAVELASPLVGRPDLSASHRALLQRVLGAASALLGHSDVAIEHYKTGLLLARESENTSLQAQLLCLLGDLFILQGRIEEAEGAIGSAARIAKKDSMEKLLVENSEGNLALEKFDLNQASLHYTNALQHAQNLLDRRWQGGLHGSLGTLAILQGQRQIAREHLEIAVQVASEMGDRQWAGNAHCNLGLLLFELNEHSAAGIQLEAALRIARDIGHRRLEATTLCNLGLVKWSQNALDSALKDFVQAVELAKVIHAPRMEGQFRGYLGELLGELGNGMEAIACFGVAESLLESGSNGSSMALLQCQRAACSCHLGDLAAAKWHLSRAETIASKMTQAADSELVNALKRARQTISLHCY